MEILNSTGERGREREREREREKGRKKEREKERSFSSPCFTPCRIVRLQIFFPSLGLILEAVVQSVIRQLQGERCKDTVSDSADAHHEAGEAAEFSDAAPCRFEDLKVGEPELQELHDTLEIFWECCFALYLTKFFVWLHALASTH